MTFDATPTAEVEGRAVTTPPRVLPSAWDLYIQAVTRAADPDEVQRARAAEIRELWAWARQNYATRLKEAREESRRRWAWSVTPAGRVEADA